MAVLVQELIELLGDILYVHVTHMSECIREL